MDVMRPSTSNAWHSAQTTFGIRCALATIIITNVSATDLQISRNSKPAPGKLKSTVAPSGKCFQREPRGDIKGNRLTLLSAAGGEFGAQVPASGGH